MPNQNKVFRVFKSPTTGIWIAYCRTHNSFEHRMTSKSISGHTKCIKALNVHYKDLHIKAINPMYMETHNAD